MKQTEAETTKAIRNLLRLLGVWHYKNFSGPMQYPKGISDILGIWEGKFMAIEVKTKIGRVSEHQVKFIDSVNDAGGLAFVARSVDDVIDKLGVRGRFLF